MGRRNRRASVFSTPIVMQPVQNVPDDELHLYVHASQHVAGDQPPWLKDDDEKSDEGRGSGEHTEDTDDGENTVPADKAKEAPKDEDEPMEKESLRRREAQILQAMGNATLPEQQRLMGDLNTVRQTIAAIERGDREVDLANAVVREHLTPVMAHSFGLSRQTDWIDEIVTTASINDIGQAMTVEATLWFQGRHASVLADQHEFTLQAEGAAHHHASAYGSQARVAARAFLDHVAHLYRRASDGGASDSGVAESQLPVVDPEKDTEVLDNFQPEVAPENQAAFNEAEGDGTKDIVQTQGARSTIANMGTCMYEGEGGCSGSVVQISSRSEGTAYVCYGHEDRYWEERNARNASRKVAIDTSDIDASGPATDVSDEVMRRLRAANPDWDDDKLWAETDRITTRLLAKGSRRTAGEVPPEFKAEQKGEGGEGGSTCSVCGDKIAKNPEGDGYHHDNGEKHDHEAKAGGSKESAKKVAKIVRDNLSPQNQARFDAMSVRQKLATVRRVVAETMADPSGASVSGLPQVEVMKALDELAEWEIEEVDSDNVKPKGQADVAGSPNPFTSAQADFRNRVQANLAQASRLPFVREGARDEDCGARDKGIECTQNAGHQGDHSGYADGQKRTWPREARRTTAMPNPADIGVSVGDIFSCSWGYDQTNYNFYEVVGLTGASVKVRPVRSNRVGSSGQQNLVVPAKGQYHDRDVLLGIGTSEATKRIQVSGGTPNIKVGDHWAYLWDGQPEYETDSMFGH